MGRCFVLGTSPCLLFCRYKLSSGKFTLFIVLCFCSSFISVTVIKYPGNKRAGEYLLHFTNTGYHSGGVKMAGKPNRRLNLIHGGAECMKISMITKFFSCVTYFSTKITYPGPGDTHCRLSIFTSIHLVKTITQRHVHRSTQ